MVEATTIWRRTRLYRTFLAVRGVPGIPGFPRLGWRGRSRGFRLALIGPAALACVSGGTLLAVLSVWPAARVGLDGQALAFVKLAPVGERIAHVVVLDRSGRRVRVNTHDGLVTPVVKLQPGARLTVEVTVRRAGWVGWLVGHSEHVRAVLHTPSARLTTTLVYPKAGAPVKVAFSAPVSVVTVGSATGLRRIKLAQP